MQVLLMRHGISEALDEKTGDDAERELTPAGARRAKRVARGLNVVGVAPATIATSPLLRARQTAAIVGRELPGARNIGPQVWPELETAEPLAVLKRLRACGEQTVLLVGHEPGMGRLAAYLLTGSTDGMEIEFRKSAVCAIEVRLTKTKVNATLLWHAPPRLLRRL